MQITSARVKNYKRVQDTEIPTEGITLIIGSNNSGKSSIIQGMHFGLTVFLSAKLSTLSGGSGKTLGFDQLIYKPTGDLVRLNHGSKMTQTSGPEFEFTYSEGSAQPELKVYPLTLRRGKNANISLQFEWNSSFFESASDRARPTSIFVPGLPGVTLREEKRTDAIVATGIAQGDSNIYLRNILLRICESPEKIERFHFIIRDLFHNLTITSSFDEKVHQFIEINVTLDGQSLPLEMLGTGCLQAIQLVAYVVMYEPALLLLDEPDAHLHPSKQRLLSSTLLRIHEETNTSIVLATHSRHLFDALASSGRANIVWMKDGAKQSDVDADHLSILMDLGALDSFELLQSASGRAVILTEDTKFDKLNLLLEANGFRKGEYFVQPFHGVDNLAACSAIADFFVKQGSNTHVLIHRDGDCMTEKEMSWVESKMKKNLPDRTHVFITENTDIEHYFCNPDHIASATNTEKSKIDAAISRVMTTNNTAFSMVFAQKRSDLKSKVLRDMPGVPSATDFATETIDVKFVKGKKLLPLIEKELVGVGVNSARIVRDPSQHLNIPALAAIAAQIWT